MLIQVASDSVDVLIRRIFIPGLSYCHHSREGRRADGEAQHFLECNERGRGRNTKSKTCLL